MKTDKWCMFKDGGINCYTTMLSNLTSVNQLMLHSLVDFLSKLTFFCHSVCLFRHFSFYSSPQLHIMMVPLKHDTVALQAGEYRHPICYQTRPDIKNLAHCLCRFSLSSQNITLSTTFKTPPFLFLFFW